AITATKSSLSGERPRELALKPPHQLSELRVSGRKRRRSSGGGKRVEDGQEEKKPQHQG
ncbi:Hypothetical predicted protein, partial [Marmota monax]